MNWWLRVIAMTSFFTLVASFAGATPQGRLSLSQASFVSPDYKLTEKKEYQFISGGIDTLPGIKSEAEIENYLQAQVRGMMAPGAGVMDYLDVTQLFWKQNQFSMGRKKVRWSLLDDTFNLGIYQPNFKWNAIQPESQGLTGFFLTLENHTSEIPWGVTAFASPLYIPNQGAGYEIKDGKFERSNPYFSQPPTTAEVNGQQAQFLYIVEKPEISEVVNQQSFAGLAYVGDRRKDYFVQASFAQKPMNELALGFQGTLIPGQKIETIILPKVGTHTVVSGEAQYAFSNVTLGISALQETPESPKFESTWTYVHYTQSSLINPFVQARLMGAEATFAVLSVQGGETSFEGPLSNEAGRVLIPLYPFRNATQAQLKYQYRIKRFENIGLSTKYLRGAEGEFDMFSATVAYQWQERWAAQLVSQMVAVQPTSAQNKTVFHSYQDNDLVAIGVSYVF
jgi:hypothetical protein